MRETSHLAEKPRERVPIPVFCDCRGEVIGKRVNAVKEKSGVLVLKQRLLMLHQRNDAESNDVVHTNFDCHKEAIR